MIDHEFKSKEERRAAFQMLRTEMHRQEAEDLKKREQENPHPTEEELRMGTFIESIEPQVREAVLAFVRKGYAPLGSGFLVSNPDVQSIYGALELSDEERRAIEDAGATVSDKYGPFEIDIELKTTSPNQLEIEKQWKRITDALPDRKQLGAPTHTSFLKKYAPERVDLIRTSLERHIAERKDELSKRKDRGIGYIKTQELLAAIEKQLEELNGNS